MKQHSILEHNPVDIFIFDLVEAHAALENGHLQRAFTSLGSGLAKESMSGRNGIDLSLAAFKTKWMEERLSVISMTFY